METKNISDEDQFRHYFSELDSRQNKVIQRAALLDTLIIYSEEFDNGVYKSESTFFKGCGDGNFTSDQNAKGPDFRINTKDGAYEITFGSASKTTEKVGRAYNTEKTTYKNRREYSFVVGVPSEDSITYEVNNNAMSYYNDMYKPISLPMRQFEIIR